MAYTLPALSELTPDDRPWRIDWFGELAYPAFVQRYRQPSIRVAISPVKDVEQLSFFSTRVATVLEEQRNVWMPVGTLPLLRIGDIWQSGSLMVKPCYFRETFLDLEVNSQTSTFIKAGVSIDDNFLLPFSEHPWHHHHTQSYCVLVSLDDVRLVIPGVELIRFYFGSSSQLLQRLFTGPLEPGRLWEEQHYNEETQHLHLKLADRLSGYSAADIGRLALSSTAMKAAASIYQHCVASTSQRATPFPYMGFPFIGRTDLSATGIWLSWNQQPKATFLVFHLDSCSYPFPFKSLTYEAGDQGAQGYSAQHKGSAAGRKKVVNSGSKGKLGNTDPGARKRPKSILFNDPVRFPDLSRKQVWRERILALGAADVYVRHEDGTLEQVALGSPEGNENARALDAVAGGEPTVFEGDMPLPHWVTQGIGMALAKLPQPTCDLKHKLLLLPGHSEPIFQLPLIVDEDGVVDVSQMHTQPDGHQRTRRACCVRLHQRDWMEKEFEFGIIEGMKFSLPPLVVEVESREGFLGWYLKQSGLWPSGHIR